MLQEFVELYVSAEVEKKIDEKITSVTGVNHRIYKNQLLFIVSRLLWKQLHHPADYVNNGGKLRTHVNAKDLARDKDLQIGTLVWYLGSKGSKVSNQLKTLKEWGIIEVFNKFKIGITARTYKFTSEFSDATIQKRKFYFKDGAFVKRIFHLDKERLKHPLVKDLLNLYFNHVSISNDGLKYLENEYKNFSVVHDVANAHRLGYFHDNKEDLLDRLQRVPVKTRHHRLWMIFERRFYASISNRNGRLDHNLTNLDREFRRFIFINGKPMHVTDIVNSQPTFSVPVITRKLYEMYGPDYIMSDDMRHYANCCTEGIFYETIAKKAQVDISTQEKRDHFKKNILFSEVFYCRNNKWKTKTQLAFKELFPSAFNAIWELKKKNHNSFAILLQQLESDLIIFKVYKQLLNDGYFALPLHDAIYCQDEQTLRHAQLLIAQAFREKHNFQVRFKYEYTDSLNKVFSDSIEELTSEKNFEVPVEPGLAAPTPGEHGAFQMVNIFSKDQAFKLLNNVFDEMLERYTGDYSPEDLTLQLRVQLCKTTLVNGFTDRVYYNMWCDSFQQEDIPIISSILTNVNREAA